MRIALLGPNGQLGSDIRSVAQSRFPEMEIYSIDRAMLDLATPQSIGSSLDHYNLDAIINTTGYHKTDEVEFNAQAAFAVNAHGVRDLARYCYRRSLRLIHCSTDYVFGGQAERQPLSESAARAPVNVYGASKAVGEDLALLENRNTIIVRVASLFGIAGSSGKGGNFVETMLRLSAENGHLRVVADQIMSPTATADAAGMILGLLQANAPSGIYHCVNEGEVSWFDFTKEIMRQMGRSVPVEPILSSDTNSVAKRPPYSALSCTKVSTILGPPKPWQAALSAYLVSRGYL